MPAWIAGVSTLIALQVAIRSGRDIAVLMPLAQQYGAYYMIAVAAFLTVAIGRGLRRHGPWQGVPRRSLRTWLVVGVVAAAAVFASLPPEFRVVSDETNMVGLSRGIAHDNRLHIATQGYFSNDRFEVLVTTNPDRPALYQTVLAAVHVVAGYRVENAFALNFVLLALLLACFGMVAERRRGVVGAGALIALLLAQPLLTLGATSASYEMLNLALLAAAMWHLARYVDRREPEALAATWLALVAAANVRAESAFVAVVVAAALGATGLLTKESLRRNTWLMAVTPWLILPCYWHARLMTDVTIAAGAGRTTEYSGGFSLQNLGINGRTALDVLFDPAGAYPYAWTVNALALAAAPWLLVRVWRAVRGRRMEARLPLLVGLAVVIPTVVTMAFWGGSMINPVSARYFLPLVVLLTLVAWMALMRVPRLSLTGALVVALAAFGFHHGQTAKQEFPRKQLAIRKLNYTYHALAGIDPDGLLVVVDAPGRYTVRGIGAVGYGGFQRMLGQVRQWVEDRTLREVIVIQDVFDELGGQVQRHEDVQDPSVRVVPFAERRVAPNMTVRLARLEFGPAPAPSGAVEQPTAGN